MHRIALPAWWPAVDVGLMSIGDRIGGEDSRLPPAMRRVHQSRCARALAIDLLAAQGCVTDAIGKGPVGDPVWPAGFVGSLSHTESYAAAVVARDRHCKALGIDVEPDLPLPPDTDGLILRDEERHWLASLAGAHAGADRLLFCAKECVHKAIHPLRGAWLDFQDVWIEVDPVAGSFAPRPASAAAEKAFQGLQTQGRYVRTQGQLLAVLAVF